MKESDRSRPGAGKPAHAPGISSDVQALRSEVAALKAALAAHIAEKNEWTSLVRDWLGRQVVVTLVGGQRVIGTLKGSDRYTLCVTGKVEPEDVIRPSVTTDIVVHKGAVAFLHQA